MIYFGFGQKYILDFDQEQIAKDNAEELCRISKNWPNKFGLECSRLEDFQKRCSCNYGEIATGGVYDIPWVPKVNNFTGPDLGEKIQVRTLTCKDLYIRPKDFEKYPDHWFVLVHGQYPCPIMWVVGHINCTKATRIGWWGTPNDRPPCWWIKPEQLKAAPSYPF